ncbi:uncharacterized protein LOC117649533 [Thrips palmi]|uniref:Uncharacterized protein LOC117649533 n=1 Tax=Thrips palmi TaxID=161013 RepID=A0A6P8ZSS8_THRPL|nr:uncharacterized protein LOC117649533 [Thrips palmi]
MGSTAMPRWASCLVLVLAAVAATAKGARRGLGQDADARSDSGRGLLPTSEQADGDLHLLDRADDDNAVRGMEAGLAPWPAQSHLAAQQEFRRLSLPMLACRSRFIQALGEAGPQAEEAVNAALAAGRAFLDRVLEDALADIPLASMETDSEIAAIQASLAAGERYPAGDILEARWRRAVRLSRSLPDDGVLDARARVSTQARPLCRLIGRELRAGVVERGVTGDAEATVGKLWKCLQHRLLPRRHLGSPDYPGDARR